MESPLYPKNERLLNRKDFVNLNRGEKRHLTEHFTVIFKENGLGISRLGITVSKKIGKAVKRNRIKRLIREFFRLNKKIFPKGFDVVFIANKGANNLMYWRIQEELSGLIIDKKPCL
jgi:ribonuclease P protein component